MFSPQIECSFFGAIKENTAALLLVTIFGFFLENDEQVFWLTYFLHDRPCLKESEPKGSKTLFLCSLPAFLIRLGAFLLYFSRCIDYFSLRFSTFVQFLRSVLSVSFTFIGAVFLLKGLFLFSFVCFYVSVCFLLVYFCCWFYLLFRHCQNSWFLVKIVFGCAHSSFFNCSCEGALST